MTKPRKHRKPTLDGWEVFWDTIWGNGPGVIHKKSGRWFVGKDKLKKMGNFFIKAADYIEAQEKK